MTSTLIKPIYQVLLALLLVTVQAQFLHHQLEFEEHSEESTCELCLQATVLGHASVNSNLPIVLTSNRIEIVTLSNSFHISVKARFNVPASRAPPFNLV